MAQIFIYSSLVTFENYYTDLFSHFYGLFYFIFVELFISKNILFKNIFFLSYNLNVIKFAGCNYNSFINLNYWSFNYLSYWVNNSNINNLRSRLMPLKLRFNTFGGFKIKCLGRFSRRQRATSYWCSLGRVPLNSIMAPIQYGFFSAPVKNSAISVKVWLQVFNVNPQTNYLEKW